MSHKYLDQLDIGEISYIHTKFINPEESVTRMQIVNFYKDMFLVETDKYDNTSYPMYYIYDDFAIRKWGEKANSCKTTKEYRNWMAQRFGIPYVLDLAQDILDIDLSKINKPAPASHKKPANRLHKILQKGVPDGRK